MSKSGWLALAAVLILYGCASPERIDLKRETVGNVLSLSLIRPPEPREYTILNMGGAASMFGLVGGLVAVADQKSKQEKFSKAMQAENFSVSNALVAALEQKLVAAGYQVKVEDGQWVEKDGRYTLLRERLPAGADAILVVAPTIIGYVSPPMAVDYLPTMTAVVTLISKDGKTELYRGYHATGWEPKKDGWRYTPPVKKFRDFDNLMASPTDSATALAESAEFISASIAVDLRRN